MLSTIAPPVKTRKSAASGQIEIIQVLRGIAASLVMVYHLKIVLKPGDPFKREIDFIFDSGSIGVTLFFIISGFVMVIITRKLSGSKAESLVFLVKRLFRIWPLYLFATALFVLIQYRFNIPRHELINALKSIFFIPLSSTEPPFLGYATLPVGWSLNYEIYFYLLIALSLLGGRLRWYLFSTFIALTLIAIPLASGGITFDPFRNHQYDSPLLSMITNPIIWNFFNGVLIGLLYFSASVSAILNRFFASKTVLLTVIVLVCWQYLSGLFGGHGPHEWGFGMAILFTSLIFYNREHQVKYPKWLIHLGDISFSLYIWHLPVIRLTQFMMSRVGLTDFITGPSALFLYLGLTLIVSHISHKIIEQKSNKKLVSIFLNEKK